MFESDAAAAEALASANEGDVATPGVASEQAPATTETQTTVDAGTNQSSESFTNIDINSLPEELRPAITEALKPFQADYTRKTQEIAPIRNLLQESGMSAEEAQQAIEFVRGLNDPSNVRELYAHLQSQFAEETAETETDATDLVDPRDKQIQDLSGRLERWEQQQALAEARTQMTTAESSIRAAHADWVDQDMERVQQLAVAHMQMGSDITSALNKAATEYSGWRDNLISSYIDGKGKVGANGSPLAPTAHAQTPEKFGNLEDATKAALARFGADWAAN